MTTLVQTKIKELEAARHIMSLGFTPKNCVIRYIPSREGEAIKAKNFDPKQAQELADRGYDTYIAVNGGNRDRDIKEGRAFFYEHDDLDIELQRTLWQSLSLPEPSFQIFTGGKSIHSYWVLKESIPIEQWKTLQKNLLAYANADPTIKNPSRIMRLAGTKHSKTGYLSQFVGCSQKHYSYDELRGVIPEQVVNDSVQKHTPLSDTHPPLTIFLTKHDRHLVEQGTGENRNSNGYKLASNLLGTSKRLNQLGINYSEDPYALFFDYCKRCSGEDWSEKEWDQIWKKASKKASQPSLTDDALESCLQAWLKRQGKTSQSGWLGEFKVPDSPPVGDPMWTQNAYDAIFGDKPWITIQGKMHAWNGKYYEGVEDAILLRRLANWCNTTPVEILNKNGETVGYQYKYAKPTCPKQALEWAKQLTGVDPNLVNPPGINFANGRLVIEWDNKVPKHYLKEHDPSYFYTYCSEARFDPKADPTDCDRLLSALEPQQQEIFLKLVAASFDMDTVRRFMGRTIRAVLCKGVGSNGKDAFREVVKQMYGGQALSSCSFSDFKQYDQGRKFPLSPLGTGPRINWSSENTDALKLDGLQSLKQAVTGDTLSIEKKGKDPVDVDPNAIFFFNVNEAPQVDASLEAIKSRYAILSFNKVFKSKPDPHRGELLADPRFKYDPFFIRDNILPAFLNKAIAALPKLINEGIDYTPCESALEEVQRESNHLIAFCQDEGLIDSPSGQVAISEIWARLQEWYQANGTLEIEVNDKGKEKRIWSDQPNRGDKNVKGPNQVFARFKKLFPKSERYKGEKQFFIKGVTFAQLDQAGGCNPDIEVENSLDPVKQLDQIGSKLDQVDLEYPTLSIQQPWAWAVMEGLKDVENRTWERQYRGDLWIHASGTYDKAGERWINQNFPDITIPSELPRKCVLGKVSLDKIAPSDSPWAIQGQYHWQISHPQKLTNPISKKGQLDLWDSKLDPVLIQFDPVSKLDQATQTQIQREIQETLDPVDPDPPISENTLTFFDEGEYYRLYGEDAVIINKQYYRPMEEDGTVTVRVESFEEYWFPKLKIDGYDIVEKHPETKFQKGDVIFWYNDKGEGNSGEITAIVQSYYHLEGGVVAFPITEKNLFWCPRVGDYVEAEGYSGIYKVDRVSTPTGLADCTDCYTLKNQLIEIHRLSPSDPPKEKRKSNPLSKGAVAVDRQFGQFYEILDTRSDTCLCKEPSGVTTFKKVKQLFKKGDKVSIPGQQEIFEVTDFRKGEEGYEISCYNPDRLLPFWVVWHKLK